MGAKGLKTREVIQEKAYELFAQKGFSSVTMKDICEATGLSRGGLYRHYNSTQEIFEEIFAHLSGSDIDFIKEKIESRIPAAELLEQVLGRMEQEMMNQERSLSYAIYEYSCTCGNDFMVRLNGEAKEKWRQILQYGISTGEFREVDIGQMTDLILYAYQGIRMWSRVIPMEEQTVHNIAEKIRKDLVKDDERI